MKQASLLNRITIDPDICHGKACIRHKRYPVEGMLDLMAAGMTIDELLNDYPDLEREDFLACLTFAARLSKMNTVYFKQAS